MSTRGIGDAFAFQRLLWLLIGTVVIPTLVLALYGFTAIRNQRAVFIERERVVHEELLQDAARMVFATIDGAQNSLRRRVERCPTLDKETCLPGDGMLKAWIWHAEDNPPEDIAVTSVDFDGLGDDVRWFPPLDDGVPLGAFRLEDSLVAFKLDMNWLRDRLHRSFAKPLVLKRVSAGPTASMEEMVEWWKSKGIESVLPLTRPLSQWRISITSGDDLATGFLGGTAWLYLSGLIALVLTVLAGTGLALRSAQREFQLSRLQTDFVSSVSHEMRTPLTSIRMFVDTLQSGKITDPAKTDECLDLLAQETDRLSRRIERVLNWASMEAGRRVYEPSKCSGYDLMVRAAQAIRAHHLLSDEVGSIRVIEPKEEMLVFVDPDAAVEALLNLLQNAIRYTPTPRDIQLHLRTKGKLVGFGVEDNGPGIPLSERLRIFEKFYRANPLLSAPSSEGSGLGLAIVRVIARDQGGSVELATEVGKGSCFTIWLPAA